jgi:hypothetical protein
MEVVVAKLQPKLLPLRLPTSKWADLGEVYSRNGSVKRIKTNLLFPTKNLTPLSKGDFLHSLDTQPVWAVQQALNGAENSGIPELAVVQYLWKEHECWMFFWVMWTYEFSGAPVRETVPQLKNTSFHRLMTKGIDQAQ